MTTGDPVWPCGHYDLRTPESSLTECSICELRVHAKNIGWNFLQVHDEILYEVPTVEEIKKWMEPFREFPIMIPITESTYSWEEMDNGKKWDPNKLPMHQIPREEDATLYSYRMIDGCYTGRVSVRNPLKSTYPREIDEKHCVGCDRELQLHKRDVPDLCWRAYHIIPEEGSEYYCRREAHYAEKAAELHGWGVGILTRYEFAQQRETAKIYLEEFPRATDLWSEELRKKVQASNEKERAKPTFYWAPYGDSD